MANKVTRAVGVVLIFLFCACAHGPLPAQTRRCTQTKGYLLKGDGGDLDLTFNVDKTEIRARGMRIGVVQSNSQDVERSSPWTPPLRTVDVPGYEGRLCKAQLIHWRSPGYTVRSIYLFNPKGFDKEECILGMAVYDTATEADESEMIRLLVSAVLIEE